MTGGGMWLTEMVVWFDEENKGNWRVFIGEIQKVLVQVRLKG